MSNKDEYLINNSISKLTDKDTKNALPNENPSLSTLWTNDKNNAPTATDRNTIVSSPSNDTSFTSQPSNIEPVKDAHISSYVSVNSNKNTSTGNKDGTMSPLRASTPQSNKRTNNDKINNAVNMIAVASDKSPHLLIAATTPSLHPTSNVWHHISVSDAKNKRSSQHQLSPPNYTIG